MLKLSFILIFMTSSALLFAQEEIVVKTDSSIIRTKYFKELNSIRVFNELKNQSKSYFTDYYYEPKRVREKGVFVHNECYGIWKEFWPNGKLKREVNYTTGVLKYFDKKAYPFYDYQLSIKLKADAIIKRIYSEEFFKKYLVWDIQHCAIYSDKLSGDWTDNLEVKPEKFLIRYAIKFSGKTYPEIIELQLDKNGRFIAGERTNGLEKLPANTNKSFVLTPEKAIILAKQKGLVESSKKRADAYLTWEDDDKSGVIYNGHFRVYVVVNTSSKKTVSPYGRSTVIDKYDVYVFNPWTGALIRKKGMHSIKGWEEGSGSSTGLIPD